MTRFFSLVLRTVKRVSMRRKKLRTIQSAQDRYTNSSSPFLK